jgi:hypothetical protein
MRCRRYGVVCNFEIIVPSLQPLAEERANLDIVKRSELPSPRSTISNAIWVNDGSTFFTMNSQDHVLFNRFRYRTVYSLGGPAMADVYKNHMLQISFTVS